jgi:hypothetical protein
MHDRLERKKKKIKIERKNQGAIKGKERGQ